jgi:transcriptional regulator with XRE-family HTH domain
LRLQFLVRHQRERGRSLGLAVINPNGKGANSRLMVCLLIMHVGVPFVVRRARLLMGMTQAEFAGLFGVDDGTVSRWERGKLHPAPKVWKQIRDITLKEDSLRDEALVRESPVYKYLVDIKRLTKPVVASRGITEALEIVGALKGKDRPFGIVNFARKSSQYKVSGTRALEIIQTNPDWQRGDIVYAEVHCISPALGGVWVDAMIAPLPDRSATLIEFAVSPRGAGERFRVQLVRLQDILLSRRRK